MTAGISAHYMGGGAGARCRCSHLRYRHNNKPVGWFRRIFGFGTGWISGGRCRDCGCSEFKRT